LKPGEKHRLIFPFKIDEQAKKGIYNLDFHVKSKRTPTRVKRNFIRLYKIGVISDPRKPQSAEPLKNWLRMRAYPWNDLDNAEDYLRLVKYDLVIVTPELAISPRGIRNLSNFTENGQSLLVVNKVFTAEEGMLAGILGYKVMQYEGFKSVEGAMTILDNQHYITSGFTVGQRIPFKTRGGEVCISTTSTGQILAVQVMRREVDDVTTTVPVISVNIHGRGKTFHMNFDPGNSIPPLSNVLRKAIDWLLMHG